jgi:serpin B
VDESGTEAEAVGRAVMKGGVASRQAELTVDHPFAFFILDDRSGAILFVGRVVDPS